MKKWKIIFGITLAIIIIFIMYSIIEAVFIYQKNIDTSYPQENLGVTVYSWFDTYTINMALVIYVFAIPLIIDIALLIISIIKLIKYKKSKNELN